MRNKLIVIGLDGATFDVLNPLLECGQMKNLATIIETGTRSNLLSTYPPITGPAWCALATGKNPGKTGIFDFVLNVNLEPSPINSEHIRKAGPFWDCLNKKGITVGIYNFPMLFPPYEVDCFMISGLGSAPEQDITYPRELRHRLTKLCREYKIGVPYMNRKYKNNIPLFINDIATLLDCNDRVINYLLSSYCPEVFFAVISATDFLQHRMWRHFETRGQNGGYYEDFCKVWSKVDDILGNVVEKMGMANIFIVSDHGFGPYKKQFFVNSWLREKGYLKIKEKTSRYKIVKVVAALVYLVAKTSKVKFLRLLVKRAARTGLGQKARPSIVDSIDLERSCAFSLERSIMTGGIYVNTRILKDDERNSIRDRIKLELISFLESQGLKANVFYPEELYKGNRVAEAPDILFDVQDFETGVSYKLSRNLLENIPGNFPKTGIHKRKGIFVANGPDIKGASRGIEGAKIYDIAPTILHMFGLPVPDDMDGRVLTEIFREDSEMAQRPVKYQKVSQEEKLKGRIRELRKSGKI